MIEDILIRLYYRNGCVSSQRAIEWFNKHDIEIFEKDIHQLSRQELVNILSYTSNGFSDIVKKYTKSSFENKLKLDTLRDMTFSEAITFLESNTDLLQDPIITERNKVLIGYNSEQIRMFLPKGYRNSSLGKKK